MGTWDRNNVVDSINIAEFFRHPQFNSGNLDNDIALLRLVRPAVLTRKFHIKKLSNENYINHVFLASVQPVRLPSFRQVGMDFNNHLARMSGFGATSDGISGPGQLLRYGLSPVITNFACRARFPTSSVNTNICTDGKIVFLN